MSKAAEMGTERDYLFSLATPLAFSASAEGLLPYTGGAPPEGGRVLLSASENKTPGILAVLGDYGALLLESDPSGESFRLRAFPSQDIGGLEPGGAWPSPDGFLVHFFRSPLPPATASPFGPRIFAFGGAGLEALSPKVLRGSLDQSAELFALFPDPRSPGAWLAQLRSSEAGDSISSSFLALDAIDGSSVPLERQSFETILRPRPITAGGEEDTKGELPKGLAAAALRIGGADFILRLRTAQGGESYWAKGSADQARSLEAWSSKAGSIILEASGQAVYVAAGRKTERELRLEPPLAGAKFGSAVFLPLDSGIVVGAVWEAAEGQSSGLLIFRL